MNSKERGKKQSEPNIGHFPKCSLKITGIQQELQSAFPASTSRFEKCEARVLTTVLHEVVYKICEASSLE
jgi:hypothetical protein